ncbi:MAG: CvpA family protein [Candidatus Tectomicrobia bacterium]
MHWFDIAVGIAFLIGGVWSFVRGLAREAISLLGITAALALAIWGSPYVAHALATTIALVWLRQSVSFAVVFLPAVLLYVQCAKTAHRLVKAAGLSLPNRVLGGLFGLVKVAVLISVTLMVLTHFVPAFTTQLAAESELAPRFFHPAQRFAALLPGRAEADFQRFYHRIQRYIGTWLPWEAGSRPPAPALLRQQVPPRSSPPPGTNTSSQQASSDISAGDAQALGKLIQQRLQDR